MKIKRLMLVLVLAGCGWFVWAAMTPAGVAAESAPKAILAQDAPPFVLSVDPISKTLYWNGDDFNYTVSISPTSLAYSVTLAYYTSVYDVMLEFSPTHLIPAFTSTMTLNPCMTIVLPDRVWYTATIVGTGGGYTQTVEVGWMTDSYSMIYLPLVARF